MINKIYILTLVFVFQYIFIFSQESITYETPFIKNYTPQDYNADMQSWNIAKDSLGILYFTNSSGVLIYDGSTWGKIALSNSWGIVTHSDGKIYVGAYNDIGFLEPNKYGKMSFVSLLKLVPEEDRDFGIVRQVMSIEDKIYFIGTKIVVFENNNYITTINVNNSIRKCMSFNDRAYITTSEGISQILGDSIVSINYDYPIRDNIAFLKRLSKDSVLIGFSREGLYKAKIKDINNFLFEGFEKVSNKISEYTAKNVFKNADLLEKGDVVITTLSGGVILYNLDSKDLIFYNIKNGLSSNAINSFMSDNEGNFWFTTNTGILYIENNIPVRIIKNKDYISDIVTSMIKYNDKIYYSTLKGFYSIEKNTVSSGYDIENINSVYNSFLSTRIINDELYVSERQGIFALKKNKLKRVINDRRIVWTFIQPDDYEDYLVVGDMLSISVYKKINNNWNYIGLLDSAKNETSWNIVQDIDGNLWYNPRVGIIAKVKFDDNILENNISYYDERKGVPNDNLEFYYVNKKIIITSGVNNKNYTYDSSSDSFVPFYDFCEVNKTDTSYFHYYYKQNAKEYWAISDKNIIRNLVNLDSLSFKRDITKRLNEYSFYSFVYDSVENNLWVGGSQELIKINLSKVKQPIKDYRALIRNVSVNDSMVYYGYDINNQGNIIPLNSKVNFQFATIFYQASNNNTYSYILEGFDKRWSSWTLENKANYTNLPSGEYTFKVKAKNIYDNESRIAEYKFVILSPWYFTWWAIIVELIIFVILIRLIIVLNLKRLKAANIKLEGVIDDRTREIKQQNEELEKLSVIAKETDNEIMILGTDGNLEWINESVKNKYGYSVEGIIEKYGENIEDFSFNSEIKKTLKELITTKKPQFYNSEGIIKDGTKIWARTTLTPVLDNNGELLKIIVLDSDITEIIKAEEKIKVQNELITYSINYSQKIQQAVMPKPEDLSKIFPESFVTLKPRDIVSGDFYWLYKENNLIYIVGADSTGHGVPGAFMSLIGQMTLNEIIKEKNIKNPVDILTTLNTRIIETLNQEHRNLDSQNDGMDLSLLCFNTDTNEVEIASANQTIYLFNKSDALTINGDIYSVGGLFSNTDNVKFTSRKITLKEDTSIYLFSDGYQDQFSGETGEKFMVHRFKDMLSNNFEKPMQEQEEVYNKTFAEWKGEGRQIDDILLIGIRYKVK